MLLLYTADESNVHQVEPVTAGERATLTMWFTLDQEHQEDQKVRCSAATCCQRGDQQ
jgi:predicted 2-oxoglutarate/Fe(II)-dependent dioxygenase YbiX